MPVFMSTTMAAAIAAARACLISKQRRFGEAQASPLSARNRAARTGAAQRNVERGRSTTRRQKADRPCPRLIESSRPATRVTPEPAQTCLTPHYGCIELERRLKFVDCQSVK